MEGRDRNLNTEGPFPILFIPKACTSLETNCELSENVLIHLNISSPDTDSNKMVIYNGLCNLKVVDGNDINIRYNTQNCTSSNRNMPAMLKEANRITFPSYNDSQVWIDPSTSPYVYNSCGTPPLESYTIPEGPDNQIIIEQHNMHITQNVHNYNEAIQYSPVSDDQKSDDEKMTGRRDNEPVQNLDDYNMYEEEEFECGVFLSQLSEEIINEKETRARDERKYVGLKTDNEALKQLMSTNIQSVSKQQKTILFLGHDSGSGQTIQNIAINDPSMNCMKAEKADSKIADDPTPNSNPRSKKYQCNKCKRIFNRLVAFKQHVVGNHSIDNSHDISRKRQYMCTECGKSLKTEEKLEQHCLAHGDPDLECNKCHKVFTSKYSLRNHLKVHSRMFPCSYCFKSYSTASSLYSHTAKAHNVFMCDSCPFSCDVLAKLRRHQLEHKQVLVKTVLKTTSESDLAEGTNSEVMSDISGPEEVVKTEHDSLQQDDSVQQAESVPQADSVLPANSVLQANKVIAKVMSNKLFQSYGKNNKKQRRHDKTCDVCFKRFDRVGDLKRHLIEHVLRSTLAKNPVNNFGVLNIRCEICQEKVFSKIDRYKAHLREHAKLTLYKCTFCDKSFSDSSNFSKHKKIHGTTYYQCDICQRKFNSKKMITQHMEYHNKNCPLKCHYCDKVYHFKSMLNKHIKYSHVNKEGSKFRCRFCRDFFKSLKDKWDHEWMVHKLRKEIMDCLVCGSRFRKFAELKRHCTDDHDTVLPPAKKLLRWWSKNKKKTTEGQ